MDFQAHLRKSLFQRVVKAGFWSLLIRGGIRTVGFIRNIVLARLLAPDDFGLFGITLVVLSIMDRFSNTGLQSALIQKRDDIDSYLDTAWSIQMLRGLLLAAILVAGAPMIAGFFEEERAVVLIQVLGVITLLKGLQNPGVLHYKRELEFRPQFIQRFGGTLIDLVVSVAFAFIWKNVWALMLGLLVGSLARLVFSFTLHPFRPRFRVEISKARELGRYGRWIFLNNALFFLAYRGDNLIVGKLLGAPALGIYMLAYSIAEVVTLEITQLLSEIAFPAYSRIQERKELLREAFMVTLELTVAVIVPVTFALVLLAKPVTSVLLGARWSEVASVLPYLAFAGSIRAIIGTGGVAFNAAGRPAFSFVTNVIGVFVTYSLMFWLIRIYGLVGVAMAVAAGQIAMLLPFFFYTKSILGVGAFQMLQRLSTSMGIGCVAGIGMLIAENAWTLTPRTSLLVVGATGLLLYVGLSLILWRFVEAGPAALLEDLLNRIRSRGYMRQSSVPVA